MPLSSGHVLLAALVLAGSTPSLAASNGPPLSYLKDREDDGCDWVRQPLPSGEPQVVFSFDEYCRAAVLAWSPDAHTLGIALQAEHDDPALKNAAPVLALFDGNMLRTVAAPEPVAPRLQGYGGSMAATPTGMSSGQVQVPL